MSEASAPKSGSTRGAARLRALQSMKLSARPGRQSRPKSRRPCVLGDRLRSRAISWSPRRDAAFTAASLRSSAEASVPALLRAEAGSASRIPVLALHGVSGRIGCALRSSTGQAESCSA
jgi:hypothetical protein